MTRRNGVRGTGFYSSNEWISVRDEVKKRDRMMCQKCGRPITGRYIVDHIEELTMDNYKDPNISLNPKNLQLLCQTCHNTKTFSKKPQRFNLW